jgi:hypothetical protein
MREAKILIEMVPKRASDQSRNLHSDATIEGSIVDANKN